ncbi:transglycosylase domain-containing protein [Dactylosporangium sp. AC04546]|uniref:transglycosylase domain-containing protein n=1 Tax=Dactylosporangium sp. AC04546 TaxID=2862460 RepID=UPI001EDF71A9|nr:transglycosylase domain-containing protein [Dactylosporangium sp. AC04546]WVK79963.1 transglycosylase domain-containing protein [Dactylosporangium sp. AC04546]
MVDIDAPVSKRRRRRRILIASGVAVLVLAGSTAGAGTYYFDQVALPEDIAMAQSTTIYYADGVTPIARIGDTNRTVIPLDEVPVDVQHAVVAAEDPTFYSNDGANWTGHPTISQQYARRWADLAGDGYSTRARVAVMALKLNQQYEKPKILELYLNISDFGRGAHGIQAAAQAYFGKAAKDLTTAEGIVLAGLIRDPGAGPDRARFDTVKRSMSKLGFLSGDVAYPERIRTADEARSDADALKAALDGPNGLVVHHVLGEVAALPDPRTGEPLYPDRAGQIRNGGLKIVTTIDQRVQDAAVQSAKSVMQAQPVNLQAALVAVEPTTGAVKAYYGGDQGSGGDYAGFYNDPVLSDGNDSCCGGHPPGATFGVYALAAGLMDGYRTDSGWNGESPQRFAGGRIVTNTGEGAAATPACRSGSPKWCTLDEAAVMSLNTPFYGLTEAVGAAKVVDVAHAAGVTTMWATVDNRVRRVDLARPEGLFGTEVGIGQYPVTVLDQAAGMATFAARGLAARTHFLKEVWTDRKKTYGEVIRTVRIPGVSERVADDVNAVLQGVPVRYGLGLADGRPVAGKTGTWQLGPTTGIAHAWMVGHTASNPELKSPGLAAAVWVGNKAEERVLLDRAGRPVTGVTLPGTLWRTFMDAALTAVAMPAVAFPPAAGAGEKTVGTGVR